MSEHALGLDLAPDAEAVCLSARAISGQEVDARRLLARIRTAGEAPASISLLLAMALFNTLNHAKEENDLQRRDRLLDELCALAQAHPEEAVIQHLLKTH